MRHEGAVSKHILSLSRGPSVSVICYKGYIINEFRFHIREQANVSSFESARDMNLIFGHVSYYGMLTDIVELHYLSRNRVILFKCDWWDIINIGKGIKNDEYEFTCLNFEQVPYAQMNHLYLSHIKLEGFMYELRSIY